MPALIALWHITKAQAGLLATSALVVSAFGGWIAGMLADRIGRARTLQITIALVRVLHVPVRLHAEFRATARRARLQGLGFGGEWAAGSVLIGEVIRAENRGKAVGTVQSGWAGRLGRGGDPRHHHVPACCRRKSRGAPVLRRPVAGFAGLLHPRATSPEPKIFRESGHATRRHGAALLEIFVRP